MISTEAEIRRYFPSPRPLSQRDSGERKYEKISASVLNSPVVLKCGWNERR